jgi:hypothetical protein
MQDLILRACLSVFLSVFAPVNLRNAEVYVRVNDHFRGLGGSHISLNNMNA